MGTMFNILATVIVCSGIIIIAKKVFSNAEKKSKALHLKFFKSLISVIVITIGIYHCMTLFESTRELGKTFMQGSALFIAILTFAAQQTLGNIISGFSVSLARPYDIGDKIKVMSSGGTILAEGIVKDITIRHTIIKMFDGQANIVPNSIMDSSIIVNVNFSEDVGNFLEIEISYESDVDKAMEIFERVIKEHEYTLKKDTIRITLSRMTANGVILKSTIWAKNLDENFKACSDIRRAILKEFKEHGIEIPYTTITCHNK